MAMPVEVLEAELLRLPTAERTRLLDHVIASLDADNARDRAWDQIAAERQAEIESGSVTAIDGHVFLAQLRAELA
jgi:hypothetical protein